MQINSITRPITNGVRSLGKKLSSSSESKTLFNKAAYGVNNFLQGEAHNPGLGAYYTLISAFVLVPRLKEAREPDEKREILTRDLTTILTILFAMKGLKSFMSSSAQKKTGLVLVKDAVGKNANKVKRAFSYFNPQGGISALDTNDIIARYSGFENKDSLVNMMKLVDSEGGNLSKVFAIDKNHKASLGEKIAKVFKKSNQEEVPSLYDSAKKLFGDDFTSKSNEELINILQNVTPEDSVAMEGLNAIIGTPVQNAARKTAGGLLNDKENNPLVNYARKVSSVFDTISLGIVASFLGVGLPKINEKLTTDRHLNQPNTNQGRNSEIETYRANLKNGQIYNYVDGMHTFEKFI